MKSRIIKVIIFMYLYCLLCIILLIPINTNYKKIKLLSIWQYKKTCIIIIFKKMIIKEIAYIGKYKLNHPKVVKR